VMRPSFRRLLFTLSLWWCATARGFSGVLRRERWCNSILEFAESRWTGYIPLPQGHWLSALERVDRSLKVKYTLVTTVFLLRNHLRGRAGKTGFHDHYVDARYPTPFHRLTVWLLSCLLVVFHRLWGRSFGGTW